MNPVPTIPAPAAPGVPGSAPTAAPGVPGPAPTAAPGVPGPVPAGPVAGRSATAAPDGARRRPLLRHARIRTKLALILLVPVLAIGALATARLVDAVGRAVEAGLVHALARVAVQAGELGHELHRERIEAVRLLAEPGRGAPGTDAAGFTRQTARTDTAATGYRAAVSVLPAVPAPVATRLAAIDAHLAGLAALRQQVLSDPLLSISAALLRYRAVLVDLGAYQATLPAVVTDADLAEQTRAVAAIAAAGAHAAEAEAIARTAALTGTLTNGQREALRATQTGQREAFTAFGQTATPQQRALVDKAVTGANVDAAEAAITALLDERGTDPSPATAAGLAGMADITRYVGGQLYDRLLDTLAATQASVLRQVVLESAAVTLVLVAAVLVAVLLARTLATTLHRLRTAAVGVAHTELPAAVARLSDPQALADTSPEQLAAQIDVPDRLRSRDEIGEVAHALYDVHRTAVHIAAEQAALRTSLSTMFVNLARRSQTLVDAIISRLDRLQRNETDAGKLQQMMALDSLATRMRRNDENLLVLAGADTSPPRSRDALAIDVLRAAQSEIEQFHRIEFGAVDDDVQVTAAAVNDVVRLVAELLDNAARFSRPDTPVLCEARRLGHQLVVQVEDRGVGMTPEAAHALNAMLARPRHVDVSTVRKMGLAVVARLAARHHIHVHLQAHRHHGTIATIALPPSVLVLPTGRHHAPYPAPAPAVADSGVHASPAIPAIARPRRSAEVVRHHAGRRPGEHTADTTMPLPILNGNAGARGQTIAAAQHDHRLPKRVPQAQTPGDPGPPPAALPAPRRTLEQTRDRLTAYQAGLQRARDHQSPPHQ